MDPPLPSIAASCHTAWTSSAQKYRHPSAETISFSQFQRKDASGRLLAAVGLTMHIHGSSWTTYVPNHLHHLRTYEDMSTTSTTNLFRRLSWQAYIPLEIRLADGESGAGSGADRYYVRSRWRLRPYPFGLYCMTRMSNSVPPSCKTVRRL